MQKVLIIDDNQEIQELIQTILTLRGFEVLSAFNAREGLTTGKKEKPDMIILDLMLPDMDGIDLCKSFRAHSDTENTPIIMLTAKTAVLDKVKGLEIGANDYLTKPFDPLELLARIKVQLRQKESDFDQQRQPLKINQIEIIPSSYEVLIQGTRVKDLTPREFDILYILMNHAPAPVERETIFQNVMGKSEKSDSRVIDIHVAKLRKKIGPERIKTIPGKGYLFSS